MAASAQAAPTADQAAAARNLMAPGVADAAHPANAAPPAACSTSCTLPLEQQEAKPLGELSSQPDATQLASMGFPETQLADQTEAAAAADTVAAAAAQAPLPPAAPPAAAAPAAAAAAPPLGCSCSTLQVKWVATKVQTESSPQQPGTSQAAAALTAMAALPAAATEAAEAAPEAAAAARPHETAALAADAARAAASPDAAAAAAQPPLDTAAASHADQAPQQPNVQTEAATASARQPDTFVATVATLPSQAPALTAGTGADAQLIPGSPPVPKSGSALQQAAPAADSQPPGSPAVASVPASADGSQSAEAAAQPSGASDAPIDPSPQLPVACTPAAPAAATAGRPEAAAGSPAAGQQQHVSEPAGAVATPPSAPGLGLGERSRTQPQWHLYESQMVRELLTPHAPGDAAAAAAAAAALIAPGTGSQLHATPYVPVNAAVSRLAASMHRANEEAGLSYVETCTTVAAVAEQHTLSSKVRNSTVLLSKRLYVLFRCPVACCLNVLLSVCSLFPSVFFHALSQP